MTMLFWLAYDVQKELSTALNVVSTPCSIWHMATVDSITPLLKTGKKALKLKITLQCNVTSSNIQHTYDIIIYFQETLMYIHVLYCVYM